MTITKLALDKLRAGLIHFGISVLVFLPFVYLIVYRWYPVPLFYTDGGWQGLRIMAMVDLVLGPSLTIMIYNPAKSRRALGFDYCFIALAQMAALIYGAATVHDGRPWTIAYHDRALHVMSHGVYAEQAIEAGTWERLGDGPLFWVYVRKPATADEIKGTSMFGVLKGTGPESLAFLYDPIGPHLQEVQMATLDMRHLSETNAALKQDYEALLQRHRGQPLRFLPLDGYFSDAIVALDDHGGIVDTLYYEAPVLIPQKPGANK